MKNKWKLAFILLLTGVVFYIAGCAATSAKLDIPNLGVFETKSWESFEDPMYGGGNIHQFLIKDTETDQEYIVIESHYGLTMYLREKTEK